MNEPLITNDEVNMTYIFNHIDRYKVLISAITLGFAIFSIFYALSIPNQFQSKALLKISNTSDTEFNSAGGLGGLASLAGISIGSSGDKVNKNQLAVETVKSRAFLNNLILEDNSLLKNILAAESYNFEMDQIIYDASSFNSLTNEWIDEDGFPASAPSYLSAYKNYSKLVSIAHNKRTGFLEISVEHFSPKFARNFLDLIIDTLNRKMRDKDFFASKESLDYLIETSRNNQKIELSYAINALIEKEMQKQMLTNVSSEYFVDIIDPPFIPIEKSKPSRARLCISITLLGLFFALLISIFVEIFFTGKKNVKQ